MKRMWKVTKTVSDFELKKKKIKNVFISVVWAFKGIFHPKLKFHPPCPTLIHKNVLQFYGELHLSIAQ